LPSNTEWDKLYRFADGTNGTKIPYKSETAGKHLKAKDSHGFSALLAGFGISNGEFSNADNSGDWWSASDINANYANFRYMLYFSDGAFYNNSNKSFLFSVRCVGD
jgi:uncharacterized protein (TIGR02145 family)